MKRMLKGFFSLALLTSAACSFAHSDSNPYFSIRSQSVNAARELVGWQTHINLFDKDCLYGSFSITPEYTRSFRSGRIAEYIFGDDVTATSSKGTLAISGSQADNRGSHDWLADYFGLPTDFKSEVTFKPRIENFLVDFNLYLGLDEWMCGLYFRIHAPVVYTRWDLRATEAVSAAGANGYAAGYMGSAAVDNATLRKDFLSAVDGTYTFGDMKEALKYGKMSKDRDTKTALADIEAALGWNFWQCEDYHFGLQIRGSAPTGNRPDSEYLFEPIVGNGKHWTLGGGVSAHAVLWRGCDEDHFFGVWLDANITHLFRAKQTRSFDLKNKPNSRYALLAEMTSTVAGLYGADLAAVGDNPGTAPSHQYASKLLPVINVTTFDVNVSIDVQVDAALKFSYYNCGFEADLGYNLWARSGEKFKLRDSSTFTEKKYVLKGDSHVYGFSAAADAAAHNTPVALSASQNTSDIHAGKNYSAGLATPANTRNPNIDNAKYAQTVPVLANANFRHQIITATMGTVAGDAAADQTKTSRDPIFVKAEDIDTSKTPSAMSHKLFGHISYNWDDCEDWIPFLGVGGEIEWAGKYDSNYAAVSQWGVWIKGGISFN